MGNIRKPASWLALLLCLGPMGAFPVGLGDIELRSALNEPLDASILLRAIKPGDTDDMRVQLADRAQFARAGIDRPFVLSDLKFSIQDRGDGSGEIVVTTKDPVTEPFLNFLIDLEWSQGRVIREYTLLLDPPVYGAAISSTVEQTVTTVEALPDVAEPVPEAVVLEDMPSVPVPTVRTPSVPGGSYGPVKSTDTLWSLAEAYRPDSSVTIQQTMMAMLRANPQAFGDNNINNLRAGSVLRIPERDEIQRQSAARALAEVKRQHAVWEDYRQSVGVSSTQMPVADSMTADTDAGTTDTGMTAADSGAMEVAEEADGRLEVVGSGTDESGAGGSAADVSALREELTLAQEQVDAQQRENEDLEAKRRAADEIIDNLQRLVEVKDDEIADLQNRLTDLEEELEAAQEEMVTEEPMAETQPAAPEVDETQAAEEMPPEPAVAEEPQPVAEAEVTPEPESAPAPEPARQKSLLDQVSEMVGGNLPVVGAGAGAVLLLIIIAMLLKRRRKKAEHVDVEVPEDLSGLDQPSQDPVAAVEEEAVDEGSSAEAAPEVDSEAATIIADEPLQPAPEAPAPAEEEDPLEGLNIYLAYEDYDNATKLVKSVIDKYPDRHEYKLRLLEIFVAAKNPIAFEGAARELQNAVGEDSPLMDDARKWWDDLSPGRALFAAGAVTAGAAADDDTSFDETVAGMTASESIFDVTSDDAAGSGDDTMEINLDDVAADGDAGDVDFDLGFEFDTPDLGGDTGDQTQTVDFDLSDDTTGTLDDGETEADIDFDLGSDTESAADSVADDTDAGADESGAVSDDTGEVDFALDLDTDAAAAAEVVDETGEVDFALDLDADAVPAEAADDTGEVDFALDADADSDTDAAPAAEPGEVDFALDLDDAAAAAEVVDDTGEVDFELDLDADAGVAEVADETGEVDFELDLDDVAPTEAGDETGEVDFSLDLDDTGTDIVQDMDTDTAPEADTTEAPADTDATLALDEALAAPVDTDNADADVDFDIETVDSDEPAQSVSEDAGTEGDGLDFDLDVEAEGDEPQAESATDTDAPDSDTTDDLDFSLDLPDEPVVDTADGLDLDLTGETEAAEEVPAEDAESTQYMLRDVPSIEEPGADEAEVDLLLDDAEVTGDAVSADTDTDEGSSIVETAMEADDAIDFELELPDADSADVSAESTPDIDTDETEYGLQEPDTATDTTGEIDFDLELPDETAVPAPDFETVQLNADDLSRVGAIDEADTSTGTLGETDESIEVDSDFAGIFGEEEDGAALNTELPDSAAAAEAADVPEVGLDVDLGEEQQDSGSEEEDGEFQQTEYMLRDIAAITSDESAGDDEDERTLAIGGESGGDDLGEIQTKLDLAQAYIDMGDTEGARGILGEVMAEGDDAQQTRARELLSQLN